MDEEKELALRKYDELYEHSKAVLAEEMARSSRTDEKASKYLTALSLVLNNENQRGQGHLIRLISNIRGQTTFSRSIP
ncbi:MAG: hypothetical protein L6Q55_02840 [Azonexus sp.]|nr:hypothetical protein [Azonexus sp.]MCK6411342.1 hypothetical protein [Azonexus sp.]